MIDYEEEWLLKLIFHTQGSVGCRAALFAVPSGIAAVGLLVLKDYFDNVWQDIGIEEITGSQTWAAATTVLVLLLAFRTRQALSRFWEGTGLLHQMRGEWFDSVSCCVTFSRSSATNRPQEVSDFRHTIVRLMSLCHGSALEEIAGSEISNDKIPKIDLHGLDHLTLKHLDQCKKVYQFNRVEVILHLIQTLITQNLDNGILNIPPPILSRVYQTLSRGFVNLLNAKKITDTRFPFPYAQLICMLLLINTVLTPIMIVQLINTKAWAAAFTMVPVFGMFSLNFVASELENPFGNDANDLPLASFQHDMNGSLLMLLHSNTDHIAGISSQCVTDFQELASIMQPEIFACKTVSNLDSSSDNGHGEGGALSDVKAELPVLPESAVVKLDPKPEPKPPQPELKLDPKPDVKPEPKSVEALKPEHPQMRLVKGMDDFSSALLSWTKLVDGQIGDLSRCFTVLKQISKAVPGLLQAAQAEKNQLSLGLDKEQENQTTLRSLQAFPVM